MKERELEQLTQEAINEYVRARDEHCGEANCHPAMKSVVQYVVETMERRMPNAQAIQRDAYQAGFNAGRGLKG